MSRVKLLGGTYDVHTNFDTGDDANPGTELLPYKTVNGALYDCYDKYDFNGSKGNRTLLVVNMAPNVTDTEGVHFAPHGGMVGAQGGMAVTIQGGGNSAIVPASGAAAIDAYFGAILNVRQVSLGKGIGAHDGAKLYLSGCAFLDSPSHMMLAEHRAHIEIYEHCSLWGDAPYIVLAKAGSCIETVNGAAVYFGKNIGFTTFALAGSCSIISVASNLNSYTAIGKRYQAESNAVIAGANDPNYYPGNAAGSVSAGGQYI